MKFVIDTDCLNFLLDDKIGKIVLSKCEIILPESIFNELGLKQQNLLEKYDYLIESLTPSDIQYTGKLLHKISGRKDDKIRYLNRQRISKIQNIGEAEGGALAKRLHIPIVLLDLKAFSTLKNVLKYSGIATYRLPDFGIYILENLGTPQQLQEFKDTIKKKYHIEC